MDRAASDHAWNSVGLLGVHCVISACDALTVGLASQRWSGQEHAGAVEVVASLNLPDSDRRIRQISEVLSMKKRVEYEAREFTEREAEHVRERAGRLLSWVVGRLPRNESR
jgi:hypothetical protein